MKQHRVWPEDSWHFSVPVTASLGVRCGDTIHVGGQVALSTTGQVRHSGDLLRQTRIAMEEVARVLAAYGATPDDMVKLVAFYVDRGDDGRAMLAEIRRHFRGPFLPVVTLIPVPYLAFDGMMVEIEGYAMRSAAGRWTPRVMAAPQGLWSWPSGMRFPHAVRCGEMIFTGAQIAVDARGEVLHPGDIVAQSEIVMENLRRVLAAFGATLDDAVKFNIYYSGRGGEAEWRKAAVVRARYFREPGPAATGIPVPRLYPDGVTIQMEVMAMLATDGRRLPRRHSWPEGHWDWPIHLPYKHGLKCGNRIFVGGQVALDPQANVLAPDDLVEQTGISMENIRKVLAVFGATLDDVTKVDCFYVGGAGQETLMKSAQTRFAHYTPPGPCSTGVPLPALAIERMVTEIEVVAMAD